MDGALVLDKPRGITSHDAVVAARRLLSEPRIGHLGTLDPFASGVLVLLVGKATRLARFYREREKTYEGTIRFGFSTNTFDCDGIPTSPEQSPVLTEPELRALFQDFLGNRLQEPPPFSAKKVSGVPSYRLARKGQTITLEAVPVTIRELDLVAIEGPLVRFRAGVSSGTYVRSLVHEWGQRLGVGAHLAQLRRTAVGEFAETAAVPLDSLEETIRRGTPPLIPLENLLVELPAIALPPSGVTRVCHGHDVEVECAQDRVRLFDESGRLVAIAERTAGNLFHPGVVLSSPGDAATTD